MTNQSQWAEAQVEGALDKADLLLLLASAFGYKRDAGGDFQFKALAGALPSGFSQPKQWTKLQSYNWRGATSGPSYEADTPILQSLEMNFNRRDDTMLTAAFAAKEYSEITQPATAPAPDAVDTQVVRNSDIRIGLSAGRLGELEVSDVGAVLALVVHRFGRAGVRREPVGPRLDGLRRGADRADAEHSFHGE